MQQRRLNAPEHVRKILDLEGAYTRAQLTEAISDAHQIGVHTSEYIINILGQRSRPLGVPGPLHLTRPGDQLEIETLDTFNWQWPESIDRAQIGHLASLRFIEHKHNGGSTLASAVLDRLLHHCETILIKGSSYRMRKAKAPA